MSLDTGIDWDESITERFLDIDCYLNSILRKLSGIRSRQLQHLHIPVQGDINDVLAEAFEKG
ncbi:MAG: hypothetical protein ACI9J4_001335 [Paraglaciecola sp.]|jgi:hypothetical protein